MALERSRAPQNAAEAAGTQRGPDELVRLIRKLRWIGMEDEAERLQSELMEQHTAADSVVATPRETD